MLRSLTHFAFFNLILIGVANSQITVDPPPSSASAVVSTNNGATNADSVTAAPIEPGQPADAAIVVDPITLLPDLPPVPPSRATLVGGTIEKLDRVRDQITLSLFGGGHQKILFDPRTRIYSGGKETSAIDLKVGQRVYLDTILDGSTVFARSIRLKTSPAVAEGEGVVVRYRADRGELTMRDSISPNPIRVRTSASTRLMQGDRTLPISSLVPGSLISVKFSPEGNGREVAREISILAMPGVNYTFEGQVAHLDLRAGLVVINSSTDHKTYEVYLDPTRTPDENLHVGSVVTVVTQLEQSRYVARNLTVNSQ